MKEITLKIPNNQYSFFVELIKKLGFEIRHEIEIPEVHKNIVRERIKNTKPEDMITWAEARKQFKFKK